MYNFVLKKKICFFRVVHWTQVRAHMSLHPYCVFHTYVFCMYRASVYKVYSAEFQSFLCTQNPATFYSAEF